MRRLIPIALIVLMAVVSLGFRGSAFRGARTVAGDYYFKDSTTINVMGVEGKATFGDTVDMGDAVFAGRLYGADFLQLDTLPLDSVTGYCTFTFDDFAIAIYDSAFPVFEDSGIAGVLFIRPLTDTPQWDNILLAAEMADSGWEIGSHGITHTSLTLLPQDSMDWELRASKDSLLAKGFNVTSFAYPGGDYNELAQKRVAKYYNCARTTAGTIETRPIKTYNLQGHYFYYDSTTYHAKAQMDTAAATKGWVIIYSAIIGDDYISTDSIRALIGYAHSKNLKIVTMQQGMAYMSNPHESHNLAIGRDGKVWVGSEISNRSTYYGYKTGLYGTGADSQNVSFGWKAGANNATGKYNVNIGYQAGYGNVSGSDNINIGRGSGRYLPAGNRNIHIGRDAGMNCISSNCSNNTYVGYFAGVADSAGFNNVAIGSTAGQNSKNGRANVWVGYGAGSSGGTQPRYNVGIGYRAGYTATGEGCVFLGNEAGYSETGHGRLYIATNQDYPLIYGIFPARMLKMSIAGNDTTIHSDSTQFRSVIDGVQTMKWNKDSVLIAKPTQIGVGGVTIDSVKVSGTDLHIFANGDATPFVAAQ